MFDNAICPYIKHFKQTYEESIAILSQIDIPTLDKALQSNTGIPIGERLYINRLVATNKYTFLEVTDTDTILVNEVKAANTLLIHTLDEISDITIPIQIVFYNGENSYESVYKFIHAVYPFLGNESIIIINKWNYETASGKLGAMDAFRSLSGKSHHIEEVAAQLPYWRGFGIFLYEKKRSFNANSTHDLTILIQQNQPCLFAKYGDGEFDSLRNQGGGVNVDGTPFTSKLKTSLLESLQVYKDKKNIFIGSVEEEFFENLLGFTLQWCTYHTVIIDDYDSTKHLQLWKAIKECKRKKIYVANEGMSKACDIFKIDKHICIGRHRWFEDTFEETVSAIKNEIIDDSNTMILVSAGMGAKPLLAKLYEAYPNAIYLDIGSAFDLVATGQVTRGYKADYSKLCEYLKDIL